MRRISVTDFTNEIESAGDAEGGEWGDELTGLRLMLDTAPDGTISVGDFESLVGEE